MLQLPKVAYTFGSSVHLRRGLALTHIASSSIVPGTQDLTHSPARQGNTCVTNRPKPEESTQY